MIFDVFWRARGGAAAPPGSFPLPGEAGPAAPRPPPAGGGMLRPAPWRVWGEKGEKRGCAQGQRALAIGIPRSAAVEYPGRAALGVGPPRVVCVRVRGACNKAAGF